MSGAPKLLLRGGVKAYRRAFEALHNRLDPAEAPADSYLELLAERESEDVFEAESSQGRHRQGARRGGRFHDGDPARRNDARFDNAQARFNPFQL